MAESEPNAHNAANSDNNVPTASGIADEKVSVVPTGGELLRDGRIIELIRDGQSNRLLLLLSDGNSQTIEPSIKIGDRTFVPPELSLSLSSALTLPSKCESYGNTKQLFESIRDLFLSQGAPEDAALVATHFVFSTWFLEILPAAPCLVIVGARPEALHLLQILESLCRHAIMVGDFNWAALSSLPMVLKPTILIDGEGLKPPALRLLSASNNRSANFLRKGELINFFAAKAIYRGEIVEDQILDDTSLPIILLPTRGKFPMLDQKNQTEIADKFQGRLLGYRLDSMARVRDSRFELPGLNSALRIVSRIFGVCIDGAPGIQAGLDPLLRKYDENGGTDRWFDLRCVAIESLLHHCHQNHESRLHIGTIANTTVLILKGRGQPEQLEPKEIGRVLRSLGFTPKRDSQGFAICLTDGVRRRVHQLARDYRVVALLEGAARCKNCAEFVSGDVGPDWPESRADPGTGK